MSRYSVRIGALILAAILCLSLSSVLAFAEDSQTSQLGSKTDVAGSTVTITEPETPLISSFPTSAHNQDAPNFAVLVPFVITVVLVFAFLVTVLSEVISRYNRHKHQNRHKLIHQSSSK